MKKLLTIAASMAFAAAASAAVIGPDNLATATQGQAQGQGQGQLQGQAQGQGQGQAQGQGQVANGGDARATGGNAAAGAVAGAAAGAISGAASTSGAAATTGAVDASSKNANGAAAIVNIEAAQPLKRVQVESAPTVYAPPAMTTAVCVIGVSAGGSGMGWGFALGSGIKDEGCEVRALSQLLHSYGQTAAAKELLCRADARVAEAYKRAGQACVADAVPEPKKAEASPPPRILTGEFMPG